MSADLTIMPCDLQNANNRYCDIKVASPLMLAAQAYDIDGIVHCLSHESNVDHQDGDGNTVLYYLEKGCQSRNYWHTFSKLHSRGDAIASHERTRALGIVEKILAYKPDLGLTNRDGLTAIDVFRASTMLDNRLKEDIVEVLERYVENKVLDASINFSALDEVMHF